MANNLYQTSVQELTKSIDECLKNKEKISLLILIYTTIDIMVWLSRDPHDADATKEDFIRWVSEFLLPGSGLECTGENLYAARCAMLHSYAPAWGTSQNNKADGYTIVYTWNKKAKATAKVSSVKQKSEDIELSIENLSKALQNAIQRFNNSLIDNRTLFELVNERSKKFFV
jgi:hypothetical protein